MLVGTNPPWRRNSCYVIITRRLEGTPPIILAKGYSAHSISHIEVEFVAIGFWRKSTDVDQIYLHLSLQEVAGNFQCIVPLVWHRPTSKWEGLMRELIHQMFFCLPFHSLTLFWKSQKPPQVSIIYFIFITKLRRVFVILTFPSNYTNEILRKNPKQKQNNVWNTAREEWSADKVIQLSQAYENTKPCVFMHKACLLKLSHNEFLPPTA